MNKSDIPGYSSVVVIGGGIMGCSTLYHLAEMGVSDAILIERNEISSGTTWHSAAQVRALRNSQNLTRMIQYSVELYSGLERECGKSVGWIQKGSLSIATSRDRLTHIKMQESLARAYGLKAKYVTADEALERWPLMNADDVLGAVWSPDDGRVSPTDLCGALASIARGRGVRIHEHVSVTGIFTANGRVRGVETTRGTVRCDAVAICAGLWSREIGGKVGVDVPVWPCEHFYLLTRPVDGISGNVPTLSDHDGGLYIRDDSGGLLVGCFEPVGKAIPPGGIGGDFGFGLLPEDWDHFEPMMINALHRLPALENAEVKMLLNGPESFTPDGTFMLGETAETKGLFLGCGMNSVGVASGGGAGMNLAHCIVNGSMACDLSGADPKRFAPVFNSVEHLMERVPEVLGRHYEISYPGRQFATARDLRVLPLDAQYRAAGAHMGQFFGWERPLFFGCDSEPEPRFSRPDWFENVKNEVMAAHCRSAVFDSSSFGKLEIRGNDSESFLMRVCAGNLDRPPGSVIYTAMLNERGTYESDLTAHRISSSHYVLYTGTGSVKRDRSWLKNHSDGFDVTISDVTEDYSVLCLMGPNAIDTAIKAGMRNLAGLGYFKTGCLHALGLEMRAARMSYVGEAGWEITCNRKDALKLYAALTSAGATPAGLYAQTSMRIEKGYRAIGHELDGDISPLEAGLLFALRKSGGFIGAKALTDRMGREATRRIASLLFDDVMAEPLGHDPIYFGGGVAGQITSCGFGYRVNRPVALGIVNCKVEDGESVDVDIAGEFHSAKIFSGPVFDPNGSRMRNIK